MKKITTLALVAASALLTTSLYAADCKKQGVTIVTGGTSFNYFNYGGPGLKKNLIKLGYDEHKIKVLSSKGTIDNMNLALNKECTIGLAQASTAIALIDNEEDKPEYEKYGNLELYGNLAYEPMWFILNKSYDDELTGKKIAIGKNHTGTNDLVKYLATIEGNNFLINNKLKNKPYSSGKITSKRVAGGIFVTAANPEQDDLAEAIEGKNIFLVELDKENSSLGSKGEGEDAVLTYIDAPIKFDYKGNVTKSHPTIATYIGVIVDEEVNSTSFIKDVDKAARNIVMRKQSLYEAVLGKTISVSKSLGKAISDKAGNVLK